MQSTKPLHFVLPLLIMLLLEASVFSQHIDEAYNQKIKEYTTDVRFLPSSVLNVTDDPKIPSPLKYFGQIIGVPGVMHRTTEIYGYYKKLTESSPFISMQQIGTTEEGRPINLVIIGNEDAIKNADHYKKQLMFLADPRKTGTTDVSQIINNAKPVFYLNG